jgi:teichuronic acid biosynthesis glycosyltransferase TuaH
MGDIRHADIICLSLSRADAPISSPALALAKELSITNRVFFIEHPYTLKDVVKERRSPIVAGKKDALLFGKSVSRHQPGYPNLFVVVPPVMIPVNFLPSGGVYRMLTSLNNRRLTRLTEGLIKQYGIREYIFINFFDPFYNFSFPSNGPLMKIYQCMDDMAEVEYSRRHGTRLEIEIVKSFDRVLCTSMELTRRMSHYSASVFYHPNAVDFKLFDTAYRLQHQRPVELQHVHTKLVGFTGSLEYRTDFSLLLQCVKRHSDKTFCFIGPKDETEAGVSQLRSLHNVLFIPPRPIDELPAFVQHFDCCIIPYKCNKLTASIYPLKVNEYLAAGKPVVSTAFSEDVQKFAGLVRLASNADEFIDAIEEAVNEDNPARREQRNHRAGMNSWSERVTQFWDIVQGTVR